MKNLIDQGCLDIWIDEIVPCLRDTSTGELKDTVVFRIESRAQFGKQKYEGVGGHLFAIAVDKSVQWGYGGAIFGFAANAELVKHYEEAFGAVHIGILHEYQIAIDGEASRKLLEVYSYEWNGNEKNS